MKKCHVGPETIRMLELGHPWVLSDRYTKDWPAGVAGELISLVDDQNRHLATALYDPNDRIVARVLDQNKMQLTREWFEKKLQQAKQLRLHARLDETEAYRWLNSEGMDCPG